MESGLKDQSWFEMMIYRKRAMDTAVWIPLHAIEELEGDGTYGEVGYCSDFFGCGTVALPIEHQEGAKKIGWNDLGIARTFSGGFDDGEYVPADVFTSWQKEELRGLFLVMLQEKRGELRREWIVHPDLVLTLKLYREGDSWICPDEGYVEVIRIKRKVNGEVQKIEIKAEFLKDYLCARQMGLWITWYRHRREIVEECTHINWENLEASDVSENSNWQGRVVEIHEGSGSPFGSKVAVFQVTREGVDIEEDVPAIEFPTSDAETKSVQTVRRHSGRKLFFIQGELWREEWVSPGEISPRIKGDVYKSFPTFITDAAGTREDKHSLLNKGAWLWFKPEIVKTLLEFRGGRICWHSAKVGDVGADDAGSVTFGINSLGLVNVYAKDIGLLPYWQQRIWAAFNVGPDGAVSDELMQVQAIGKPNITEAPESNLANELERLGRAVLERYGVTAFKQHESSQSILARCHRFRATSFEGLLELAKDLARISADSIDTDALLQKLTRPNGEKWGSLKCLEKIVSLDVGDAEARGIAAPLFGIYDLRLADAHLPTKDLEPALKNAGVDSSVPLILQGEAMMTSFVMAISRMASILEEKLK